MPVIQCLFVHAANCSWNATCHHSRRSSDGEKEYWREKECEPSRPVGYRREEGRQEQLEPASLRLPLGRRSSVEGQSEGLRPYAWPAPSVLAVEDVDSHGPNGSVVLSLADNQHSCTIDDMFAVASSIIRGLTGGDSGAGDSKRNSGAAAAHS
jgi:hypothetical protein